MMEPARLQVSVIPIRTLIRPMSSLQGIHIEKERVERCDWLQSHALASSGFISVREEAVVHLLCQWPSMSLLMAPVAVCTLSVTS